jgi:hypothetical protein
MIPKNIKPEHIIKAIEEIKKVGIPAGRSSKKFLLEYNGEFYPPKYTVSLANKYANEKELFPQEFSGGAETNDFLKDLGFNIVEKSSKSLITKPLKKNSKSEVPEAHHDGRCQKCKETVKKLLEKIYGKVEQNYKFEIGTKPDDFKNTPYYYELKRIFEALQSYRGFKEFVKSRTLPNCDFFVSNQGFIVEFDETQHFTLPRKVALENYPKKLELGFNRQKWIELCKRIKTKDTDPPYRDEQRAWYDTLRDFLPLIKGLKPTIRLFAKDYVWCSFDPNNSSNVKRFENILKGASGSWEIEVREEPNPFLARVIIAGEWEGDPIEAKQLLDNIYKTWPKGRKVKFLITCGGFIQFDWPESVSWNDIGDNKNPSIKAVDKLVAKAEDCAKFVLREGLCRKLSEVTDYITLGIDSHSERGNTQRLHIELVLLIDLRSGRIIQWTGKSYPHSDQQDGLIRIKDLESHFIKLKDIGKLMLLGCHDLKMFDPRHYKRENMTKWRKDTIKTFHSIAKKNDPNLVLHHPHSTVKRRTWCNAWIYLKNTIASVNQYASAFRYYEPGQKCDELEVVLKNTKCGDTIDFIVKNEKAI